MEHSTAETMAMMAMGDPDVSVADRAHVYACDQCREKWEALSRVVTLARSNPPMQPLQEPSPVVWDRISASLRAHASGATESPTSLPSTTEAHLARKHRSPRRRRVSWVIASTLATLSLVIGIAGGIAFSQLNSTQVANVVASAELQAFPDWEDAQGEARLEKTASGQRELVVRLSTPLPPDGYREVWVMSPSLKKLISVGVLTGSTGRFALPGESILSEYPLVDISQEPNDGNPAHSGDSIVRGELS